MSRTRSANQDGASDVPTGASLRNIRIIVAYDGTGFHGWQRQPSLPTVQACLEEAIARVTGEPVKLFGSGRTDAGVHALGQVANFTSSCRIPLSNLIKAVNNVLPPEVRVRQAGEVAPGFHARYDVRSKTYRYRILQSEVCSPFLWRFVWHYPYPLDRKRMAAAARSFVGRHDFTSFAASGASEDDGPEHKDDSASMIRTVFSSRILWSARTQMLVYEVRGSGFHHHMVRNLAGTLVEVGRGKLQPADMLRILKARRRTLAGPTAPAPGLCLVRVEY
ncbi:MAG TPA: tRNA pseudouridine(38-40) synthase TruA [Terriglobia bacterium]|nr:tRNA pseudouridine(38-40) synthase TruA [Terriglobia bacterium]